MFRILAVLFGLPGLILGVAVFATVALTVLAVFLIPFFVMGSILVELISLA